LVKRGNEKRIVVGLTVDEERHHAHALVNAIAVRTAAAIEGNNHVLFVDELTRAVSSAL
jgi:hypothetical protein